MAALTLKPIPSSGVTATCRQPPAHLASQPHLGQTWQACPSMGLGAPGEGAHQGVRWGEQGQHTHTHFLLPPPPTILGPGVGHTLSQHSSSILPRSLHCSLGCLLLSLPDR